MHVRVLGDASPLAAGSVTLLCAGYGFGSLDALSEQRSECRATYGHYTQPRLDVRVDGQLAGVLEEHDIRFEAVDEGKSDQRNDAAGSAQEHKQVSIELCQRRHVEVPDGADGKKSHCPVHGGVESSKDIRSRNDHMFDRYALIQGDAKKII